MRYFHGSTEGNPRYAGEEHKQYAEYFRAQTAPALLQPAMAALSAKADGGFLTEDVQRMCIMYVANCVEMSPTYKVRGAHCDRFVSECVYHAHAKVIELVTRYTGGRACRVMLIPSPTA